MNEKNDSHPETQPVRPASAAPTPTPSPTPTPTPATDPAPADASPATTVMPPAAPVTAKPSIGERVRTTRGLIAVGLAALIIGGLGGAAVHAAVDSGGPGDRFGFDRGGPGFGPAGSDRRGPGGFEQRGPGGFGQGAPDTTPAPVPPTPVPPTTAPEDDSDS